MNRGTEVLVVTADPDLLLRCRAFLEFEGYRVSGAWGAEQASRRLHEEPPAVVLLDTSLPGAVERLLGPAADDPGPAAEAPHVPVILLASEDVDLDHGWDHRVAGALRMPLSPLALSQTLQDLLASDPADEAFLRRSVHDRWWSRPDPMAR